MPSTAGIGCEEPIARQHDQNMTCRSFATISSGLYRFLAIAVLLDVKDIPQVGPLQWGLDQPLSPDRICFSNDLAVQCGLPGEWVGRKICVPLIRAPVGRLRTPKRRRPYV